eukprot:Gb_38908 [translate_table: standard]
MESSPLSFLLTRLTQILELLNQKKFVPGSTAYTLGLVVDLITCQGRVPQNPIHSLSPVQQVEKILKLKRLHHSLMHIILFRMPVFSFYKNGQGMRKLIDNSWNLPSNMCPCADPENLLSTVLGSWSDYYSWRCLPLDSPVALLLHWVIKLMVHRALLMLPIVIFCSLPYHAYSFPCSASPLPNS